MVMRSDSPGEILLIIVREENFTLANNPSLQFEAHQKQSAVIFCHIHCLIKVESQKFIPAIEK
jgi:hypothetical protein